jgi:hypothetical protein
MLIFLNVHYVSGMKLNLLLVSWIMRHYPHLDVNFSNHKYYIVDEVTKKTIGLGLEDHGLFRLVYIEQIKEYALVFKGALDISIL